MLQFRKQKFYVCTAIHDYKLLRYLSTQIYDKDQKSILLSIYLDLIDLTVVYVLSDSIFIFMKL